MPGEPLPPQRLAVRLLQHRLALPAAVGLSLVVLFSPGVPSEQGLPGVDKLVHAALFALLAATALGRFERGSHERGRHERGRFERALPLVALYAPVSEVLQAVLPIHRDGSVADAAADLVGVIGGWLVVRSLDRVTRASAVRR